MILLSVYILYVHRDWNISLLMMTTDTYLWIGRLLVFEIAIL